MKYVNFFGHQTSKLIVGDNPMNGYSYIGHRIPGSEMVSFYTAEKFKETLFRMEELGYKTMLPLADPYVIRLLKEYRRDGGLLFFQDIQRSFDDVWRQFENVAEGLNAVGRRNFGHLRARGIAHDEIALLIVILDAFFAVEAVQDRVGHHFAVETFVPMVLEFFDGDAFDGVFEAELHGSACATGPEFHRFKRRAHETYTVRGKREEGFAGAEGLREWHRERVENQVTGIQQV